MGRISVVSRFFMILLPWCALFFSGAFAQSTIPGHVARNEEIVLGHAAVALDGPWKFHIGDSPDWATPNFDDSHWESVDLTPNEDSVDPGLGSSGYVPGWTTRGHPGYWGYAWYRIKLTVHSGGGQKLALSIPASVDDAYQVFANGSLLGSFGDFSKSGSAPITFNGQPEIFQLPTLIASGPNEHKGSLDNAPNRESNLVLAFRLWMGPSTLVLAPDAGGIHRPPFLGQVEILTAQHHLDWLEIVRSYAYEALLAGLFLLLAIVAACLRLFDRSDPVYMYLSAVFMLMALDAANLCLAAWTRVESLLTLDLAQDVVLRALVLGGWVMVWWVWFRLHRPAWVPWVLATLTTLYMLSNSIGEEIFFTVVPRSVSMVFRDLSIVVRLFFLVLLILIVGWGIRKQGKEGWLALPSVVLVGIAQFQNDFQFLSIPSIWFPFGVQISIADIARPILVVAISMLLLRRLLFSVSRQREVFLDIKQAQEVQKVLIPEHTPPVRGLTIESEYHPAREVGGDFFQILPHPEDDSVLIVVGDVTGKGLQAGMLVALIVGAVRNQVETSFEPLEMLQSLNRRLCGRGRAHATCLALRITKDGGVVLANAGHLPPYLNGKELSMEGAMPLGMLPTVDFPVTNFTITNGDGLMIMTDGVPEAQDEKGELFGFERIETILQRVTTTAAELAQAAQRFSSNQSLDQAQADDILVLRVVRDI